MRGLTFRGDCRFQLVGVACLRVAIEEAGLFASPPSQEELVKALQAFAAVTNKTFSAAEVDKMTKTIQQAVPGAARKMPNPQIFLRVYWYASVAARLLPSNHMHVYFLAG